MTHTLHRQGSIESLREDYVAFIMGGGIPFGTYKARLRRKFPSGYAMIKKCLLKLGVFKMLKIINRLNIEEGQGSTAVFTNKEELVNYLKELKERNIGSSVVVSGLFDDVNDCLKELNLSPHTVQFSLGIFGKKELLPKEEVLQITSMCGHHMISPRLVEKLASDMKHEKLPSEESVRVMSKQCVCGAFNETRAAKLMEALTKKERSLRLIN